MEYKTVQQYYATADGNRPLVKPENSRLFALDFPADVSVMKLTADHVNIVDILPFKVLNEHHPLVASGSVEADGQTFDDIFVYFEHKNVNENGDSVLCNYMTYGKKCPICEERQRKYNAAKAAGNPKPWEDPEVKALKAQARVLMNVIDWRNREKGIQILAGSDFILRQGVLNGAKVNRGDMEDKNATLVELGQTFTIETYDYKSKENKVTEHLYYASPTNGFGVEIECTNDTFGGNEYAKPIRFGLRARKDQYKRDIVDKTYDLPSFLVQRPYDEVEKIFYGVSNTEPNEEFETKASIEIASKNPDDIPQRPTDTPVVGKVESQKIEEKRCKYGHKLGLEYETTPECSDCLDENTAEFIECKKARRMIENL